MWPRFNGSGDAHCDFNRCTGRVQRDAVLLTLRSAAGGKNDESKLPMALSFDWTR
jgi:hypothetical protein